MVGGKAIGFRNMRPVGRGPRVASSPLISSRCVQPVEHRGGRPSSPQTRRQSKRCLFAHGPPTSIEVSSSPRVPARKSRRDVATARHPLPSRDALNPPGHLPRDRPAPTPKAGAREVSTRSSALTRSACLDLTGLRLTSACSEQPRAKSPYPLPQTSYTPTRRLRTEPRRGSR